MIAANRALLAALVATNFLGQNTPAIAATEATYAEFWAQDAGAMYGYAGAATTASQLTPFTAAPATTNDSGQATQSAATAQSAAASTADSTSDISAFLTQLNTELTQFGTERQHSQQCSSTATSRPRQRRWRSSWRAWACQRRSRTPSRCSTSASPRAPTRSAPTPPGRGPCSGFGSLLKNWWQVSISIPSLGTGIQGIGPLLHPTPITGALSPLLHSGLLSGSYAGAGNVGALASVGRAGTIGSLSVPQNWASAVAGGPDGRGRDGRDRG